MDSLQLMKQLNNKYIQLGKILNQTFVYLYHLHQDQRFGPIFSCVVLLVIKFVLFCFSLVLMLFFVFCFCFGCVCD